MMKYQEKKASSCRVAGLMKQITISDNGTFFGIIDTIDKGDHFFHSSQCLCDSALLIEGTPVSFDRVRSVKKNEFEVRNINILQNETNQELLVYNASSVKKEIRIIANCALFNLETTDSGASQINILKNEILKYHDEYALHLHERYLAHPSLIWLQKAELHRN